MELLMIFVGLPLLIGVGVALYEWRKKRVLLQHDLSVNTGESAHVQAERIRAEDVTLQRPNMGPH